MSRALRSPFLSAFAGGVVVAVALLVLGVGGSHKTETVIQQSPVASSSPAASNSSLTPHAIYQRAAPGVVFIRSQIVQNVQSPFFLLPQRQSSEATGSGFVIDDSGHILTNYHVIEGASKVTVQFENNQVVTAKVVGRDSNDDIALLKVDPSGLKLDPLTLGDSSKVQVGDPTLAIGNPFGLDRTLTSGIVSALQRQISAPNGFTISHVIQTDAAINPGNSGGPLLDAAGRVIGINSQIATGTGSSGSGSVGIGFAVPINTAKQILPQLERTGRVEHAYLGIEGVTIDQSLSQLGLAATRGVLVQSVTPGGPAARAGLRGGNVQSDLNGQQIQLGGDVITAIDGHAISTMDDLVSRVDAKKPGQSVTLGILRSGKRRTITVTLATRPTQAPAG
jgi:S1-C subfamily serine protease